MLGHTDREFQVTVGDCTGEVVYETDRRCTSGGKDEQEQMEGVSI
jgi:hypothetical protein